MRKKNAIKKWLKVWNLWSHLQFWFCQCKVLPKQDIPLCNTSLPQHSITCYLMTIRYMRIRNMIYFYFSSDYLFTTPPNFLCRPLLFYTNISWNNYFSCHYILHLTEVNEAINFQRWKLFHICQLVSYKCFSYYIFSHHSHEIKMGFTVRIFTHIWILLLNTKILMQNITFDYQTVEDRTG